MAYGIMVKTMAVVAPLVLHLPAEEIAAKHRRIPVCSGIISGAIAAYMFNRFFRIQLPEYRASLPVSVSCRSFPVWRRSFWA